MDFDRRQSPARSATRCPPSSPRTSRPTSRTASTAPGCPTTTSSPGRGRAGLARPELGGHRRRAAARRLPVGAAGRVRPGPRRPSTDETTMMVARVIRAVGSDELKAAVVPGSSGRAHHRPRHDRARGRLRRRRRPDPGPARRRPVDRRRPEDVHDERPRHRYVFLLTRTNPDVPKHRGLTMFLVAPRPAGRRGPGRVHAGGRAHEHRLLQRRAGSTTAGASARSTAGGRPLMISLQDEHSAPFGAQLARLVEAPRRGRRDDRRRPIDDPDVRERLDRLAARHEVARLLKPAPGGMEVVDARGPHRRGPAGQALRHRGP